MIELVVLSAFAFVIGLTIYLAYAITWKKPKQVA